MSAFGAVTPTEGVFMILFKKFRNLLIGTAALVLLVIGAVCLILGGIDHIEDTNGPEDFSLQTITDQ